MAGKNTAVFGIYPNRAAVEEAVDQLRAAGFRGADVSVLLSDNQGAKDFAPEKATKAPEGATTGVAAGGLAGGVLGWLTGAVGGMIGALAGMGIPEYEAKRYEGRVRDGGVLLSVHCDNSDWVKRAKTMLRQTGAQDIAAAGEEKGDYANADKPLPRVRTAGGPGSLRDDEIYDDDTTIR